MAQRQFIKTPPPNMGIPPNASPRMYGSGTDPYLNEKSMFANRPVPQNAQPRKTAPAQAKPGNQSAAKPAAKPVAKPLANLAGPSPASTATSPSSLLQSPGTPYQQVMPAPPNTGPLPPVGQPNGTGQPDLTASLMPPTPPHSLTPPRQLFFHSGERYPSTTPGMLDFDNPLNYIPTSLGGALGGTAQATPVQAAPVQANVPPPLTASQMAPGAFMRNAPANRGLNMLGPLTPEQQALLAQGHGQSSY